MTGSPEEATSELIRAAQTNGANYGIMTDDIITRLRGWRARCAFEVTEIKSDGLMVRFLTLPPDLDAFAREVDASCPDVIDPGFGCDAERLEAMEESGQDAPEGIRDLAEGLDAEDEGFGLELRKRSLMRDKGLHLWWD